MTVGRRVQPILLVLLVGTALLGAVLFGVVAEIPLPGDAPRVNVRHLFEGLILLFAGGVILASPAERRPRGAWIAALAALPLWACLSLVSLPIPALESVAPARAEAVNSFPAGPLEGCDGPLIGPAPEARATITSDRVLTRQAVFYLAAGGLAFLASLAFFSGRRRRLQGLVVTLALFALAESVYGLWQWASGTPMVLWEEKTAYAGAASGTLINRNHFAQLVYLGLAASLALLLRPRAAGADPVHRERAMALRVALGLAVVTELAAILASRSRAGLGCAAIVLLVSGIAWIRRRGRVRPLELLLAALLFVPLAAVTAPPVLERLSAVSEEWTGEASRGEVYRTSMKIVGEHPIFGTGAGTFALVWGRYRPPTIHGAYNYAHSDYLQVLIETGLPGLLFALLPVGLFVAACWRRGRRPIRDDPLALPLLGALAAVALHELVDFGMQIPPNMVLVAILAGALTPPPLVRAAGHGGRLAAGVAIAGMLVAPLAALHSVARWPGFEDRLPWPDPPSVEHRVAGKRFDAWRGLSETDPGGARAAACESLEHEARAIAGRPLSATYRVGYATRAAALLEAGVLDRPREEVVQAVSQAADRARRLDPWNARHRNRLLRVALALGQFERAFADADAAARADTVSRRMIRDLLKLGLPVPMVARVAESRPVPYRELLAELWRRKDRQTLAMLVPPEIRPDPAHCFAGGQIRAVLRRIHQRDARPFLEGCLEIVEQEDPKNRQRRRDQVLSWLALEALDEQDIAEARRRTEQISPGNLRDEMDLRIAYREQDWPRVGKLAQRLLLARRGALDPRTAARYHTLIAESLARRGRYGDALEALRRALYYDRASERLRRWVHELEIGNDPFPSPAPPPRPDPPRGTRSEAS